MTMVFLQAEHNCLGINIQVTFHNGLPTPFSLQGAHYGCTTIY
jgi:hypothetical protein